MPEDLNLKALLQEAGVIDSNGVTNKVNPNTVDEVIAVLASHGIKGEKVAEKTDRLPKDQNGLYIIVNGEEIHAELPFIGEPREYGIAPEEDDYAK